MFESIIFLKIAAFLFIFLTLAISIIAVKFFKLQKWRWNFADIAFPLYAIEFYLISDKAYYNSLLPHLVFALSFLAIGLCAFFLFKKKEFSYKKFFKFFLASWLYFNFPDVSCVGHCCLYAKLLTHSHSSNVPQNRKRLRTPVNEVLSLFWGNHFKNF